MATITKITKTAVDAMILDPFRPTFLWDSSLPGFGVKMSPQGMKRYVVKYRASGGGRAARQRWLTLGGHGQLTPDQARKMAQQALAAVARGEDPQGDKATGRGAATLSDVWDRFEKERLPSLKEQTQYDYRRQWSVVIKPKLGSSAARDLSANDVDKFHKKLRATPYRANRALALVSRLLSLAEVWQHRQPNSNPCAQVDKFREKPRTRYLNKDELNALGAALNSTATKDQISREAANAIRLLLLTGARLNEILSAQWQWVDYKLNVIALPDSKTGKKPVFLSNAALSVLKNQRALTGNGKFLFPGKGKQGRMVNLAKPWAAVCKTAGLTEVRLHDLRHTAASIAVSQGASLPIIGRLLGHTQAQTTLRYTHVDADPALVAANAMGDAIVDAMETRAKGKRSRSRLST